MDTDQTDVASHSPSPSQQKELTELIEPKTLHVLMALRNVATLTEGYVIVSSQDVLKTCAYYVGTWCVEWTGDEWLWQPYSRDTDYMGSFEEARSFLDYWDQADMANEACFYVDRGRNR